MTEGLSDRRWILGCTAGAVLLRLFRIGHQNLWIDEAISIDLATWSKGAEFWRGLLHDIHGPFTSALLHVWSLGGASEGWLRLLYVLPTLGTVPLVYALARRLLDRVTARVASLALAVSPFHVWYSQEIRNYSWSVLWATAALLVFARLHDGEGTRRDWFGLGALLALALLTNFSFVFLLVALSAFVLVRRPFSPRFAGAWTLALVGVGLVFLPWFVDWFQRIGGDRLFVDRPPPTGVKLREASGFALAGVPYAYWTFAFGYSLGPSLLELHLDRSLSALARHAPVLALGGIAVGVGTLFGLRGAARRGRIAFVLAVLAVPLALAAFLAVREIKTFHPRYLVSSFPLFLVLLAHGWSRASRLARGAGAVALALAALSLGQHYFDPTYAKEDTRGAAALIAREERPGDTIAIVYASRPFRRYYAGYGGSSRLHYTHKRYLRTDDEVRTFVDEAMAGDGRVWLLLVRWWDVAPEARVRKLFEERLHEVRRWDLHGVKVTLLEPDGG